MSDVKIELNVQRDSVRPKTLAIKAMPYTQGAAKTDFYGVFGGKAEDVWVATFADEDEAKAWVAASNHFGQEVKGVVLGTRINGGAVPDAEGGSDRGSVREVQGDSPGGTGSSIIVSE